MKFLIFLSILFQLGCSKDFGIGDEDVTFNLFKAGNWSSITPAPIAGRAAAVTHWTNAGMLVWGGEGSTGSLNDGAIYDPFSNTWHVMSSVGAPSNRTDLFNLRDTGTNDKLIIWGGRAASDYYYGGSTTFTNRFDGAIYSYLDDTWAPIKVIPDSEEYAGRAYLYGYYSHDDLFVFWGGDNNSDTSAQAYNSSSTDPAWGSLLDLGADWSNTTLQGWSSMSSASSPDNRKHAVSVYTGSEMIIWSGCFDPCTTYKTDGYKYSSLSDIWSGPISTVNAPSPRRFSFYVWTGNELIIWGGLGNGEVPLESGAIYNPVSDTWRAMSTWNAPSPRANTTPAIWTGSHFIVFGGMAPSGSGLEFFNDGGIYDPVKNKWVKIRATTHLPLQGIGKQHMVFTGDSLIIWGGWDGTSTYTNKGAKFELDPDFYP